MTRPSRGERASRAFERVKTEPGLARNTLVVIVLIVMAAVVGGIVLANQRFVTPWDNRQVFYAAFEASPGISPGNGQEVRIAGVQVGDITSAEVDDHGQALLKMSIERGHKIYENAKLTIRPKSPLNEIYVEVSPGGPPAPVIPENYTFPRSSTVRPIQIDEVLDHLDDNARTALTALLAESDVALTHAQTELPKGLDGLRMVADDLKPVSQQLALRKQHIRDLISALGEVSNAIGGDDKRIQTLANGLQTTLHAFGTHEPQLNDTLAELPGLVHNLHRSTDKVQDLADQLDPTLDDLEEASDDFPKALKDLRGTADQLDDVVDAAKPFLHELRHVVRDLRPFADDLHDALPTLRRSTQRLDPITRALLPYLPNVAAFTVQTRSIVSTADANGGVLRGLAIGSPHTVPPFFGPQNGVAPLPVPKPIDQGQAGLQRAVPSLTGTGQSSPPQDGSDPGTQHRDKTAGEHESPHSGPADLPVPHGAGGLLGKN